MLERNWLLILLSLIVVLLPSFAAAQPKTLPTPASQLKSERVEKGKPAPFAGTLLNDAALAKLIADADAKLKLAKLEVEQLQRRLKLEQDTASAICSAQLAGEKQKYTACSKDADRVRDLLSKASNQPWYMSPYLHFIMGNVVAGGVCVAATRIK